MAFKNYTVSTAAADTEAAIFTAPEGGAFILSVRVYAPTADCSVELIHKNAAGTVIFNPKLSLTQYQQFIDDTKDAFNAGESLAVKSSAAGAQIRVSVMESV